MLKKVLFFNLILTIAIAGVTFAGTVSLPRTGQTKCWDTNGYEIPCAGTGQDGDIQAGVVWPEPRFTDNGDDTMTDNLTGLMWTKNAELTSPNLMDWSQAIDFCNNLKLGGHKDWRLPNVNELESLINANEFDSTAWLVSQGFTNVLDDDYWSSTTNARYTDAYAWYVHMYNGRVEYGDKVHYLVVWPVRSGQCGSFVDSVICLPQTGQTTSYYSGDDGDLQKGVVWPIPRFTDHGNSVTDNLTGLMWTKDANLLATRNPEFDNDGTAGDGDVTWQHALDYVAKLNAENYLGQTDWRLPNWKELYSLTDFSKYNPSLPTGHPFINVYDCFYWSSTTRPSSYNTAAWHFSLCDGYVDYTGKSGVRLVWPVRAGQIGLGYLDISVNKTDLPDPVTVGNNLTYTIVVTNNGPETATGVTLTDTLPAGVIYVAATSTLGTCSRAGSTVTCNIGTLYNASSATVTIIVTPTTAGTITNTATVTCNETDTNTGNNTATATTTVNASPTGCSTWNDVIEKYNTYVSGQAGWADVITCYNQYVSP